MKKMILALGLALAPVSVFAEQVEVINTKVNCTISTPGKSNPSPKVFSAEAQQNKSNHIQVQEFSLWPLNVSGEKNLLISKNGVQGTYAYLTLGPSKSSSIFISLPLEDGDVQNCIVLMTKVMAEKPYIFELYGK